MAQGPTPFPNGIYVPFTFTKALTFAHLPAANAKFGWTAMVSDANTTTVGAIVSSGGGSSKVAVYFDGTNWRVMGGTGEGGGTAITGTVVTATTNFVGPTAGVTGGVAAAAGQVGELLYGVIQQNVSSPISLSATYGTSPNIACVNSFSTVVPQPVTLANSGGALPTGFSATTVYYTIPSETSGTSIQLATTIANAFAGTAITYSGGSGTQTLIPGCLTASGTLINVTGLDLTAGDWNVWGQVAFWDPTTGTETVINAALSTTTGSLPGPGQVINGSQVTVVNAATTELGNTISDIGIPMCTVLSSGAEIVYMMTSVTEATEVTTAYGFIAARRVR